MLFTCANVEIDESTREIRRDGRVVHVEPRVFDVLLYLIRHRARIVSKQELLDSVWADAAVGESALTRCVHLVRRALGDPKLIEVVHRHGYRFVGAVALSESAAPGPGSVESSERGTARGRSLLEVRSWSIRSAPTSASNKGVIRVGLGPGPAFVGRVQELALVESQLDLAVAGRGGMCLIHGEAGVGKSRFLLEFATSASARGALAIRGESLDAEGAPAFWPWLQVLRRLVRAAQDPGVSAEFRATGAELGQIVTTLAFDENSRGVGGEGNRWLFFERIAEVLERVGRAQPLVVLIDDLHQADPPSLHLFRYLTGALAQSRVMLLGAYRAAELAGDPVRSAALGPPPSSGVSIELKGLSTGDIETLLRSRVAASRLEELARSLHEKTAGNPFYLTQLMPLVDGDGTLLHGELPRGVRGVIRRRIAELGAECLQALSVASVFGMQFQREWLEMGRQNAEIATGLERAIGANLLREVGGSPDTFEFVHGLIRDALYEELGASRRAALHRDAAAYFETVPSLDEERRLAVLAHHHARALPLGDAELALSYAIRAGTQALARYAYEVGCDHFSQALRIVESGAAGDEDQYFALLLDLGHTLTCSGQRDAARATFDRAIALARRRGQVEALARVALRIQSMFSVVDWIADEDEIRLLEEAAERLRDEEPELKARIKIRLAVAATTTKTLRERIALIEDAERLLTSPWRNEVAARVLCARLVALWQPDNLNDRISWAEDALVACQQTREYGLLAGIHIVRLALAMEKGDLTLARAASAALAHVGLEYHQPKFFAEGYAGTLAFMEGRLMDAERLCMAMLQSAERTKMHGVLQAFGAVFSVVRIERGCADDVLEMLRSFGDQYSQMPGWRALLAYAWNKAGRTEDARRALYQLAQDDFPIPRDSTWLGCMAMLSEVCADLGDRQCSQILRKRLAPYADRHAMAGMPAISLGSMHRFLGLLSALGSERSAACSHFEAAIESNSRSGARLALAYSQHDYAELLRTDGDETCLKRAGQLQESALAAARLCGAVHLERRIERAGRIESRV